MQDSKLPTKSVSIPANLQRNRHVPELDTFRAIAILSVMCLHWLPATSVINRLQGQVSNGVHLFFVLSGYLITRILMASRENIELGQTPWVHSFRQFYARRFLRIFPAYYLALLVGVLFNFVAVRHAIWWHASYLSNVYYYLRKDFDGPASLFWTLAVEEQFYLIWPLAILLLPKRALLPFVLTVAAAGTAIRVDALLHDSWSRILLPQCMNFLAIGSAVAVAESRLCGSESTRRKLLLSFGVVIACLICASAAVTIRLGFHAALESPIIRAVNQPMVYGCLFSWAAAMSGRPFLAPLRTKPVVFLGKISYGLYLYHLFVTFALLHFQSRLSQITGARGSYWLTHSFASRFAVTVAVASVSWFLYESPLNNLKRYFPYAQKQESVPSAS